MIACHSRREHEAIFGAAEGSPLVLCSEGDLSPGMANRAGQADVSAILRVSDHTDEGSGGDSQKPAVNDSVLYHSLLGLARLSEMAMTRRLDLLVNIAVRKPTSRS